MTMRFICTSLLLCASCTAPQGPPSLENRLLEIAREYVSYGRVDDENRWTPTLCKSAPSEARFSESDDAATHGRKIYYLFAKHRTAYIYGFQKPQPMGQVIVKEAWRPKPVEPADEIWDRSDKGGSYTTSATLGGKEYTIAQRAALFIMLKTDGSLGPEWAYGTITPDAKTVIQSGRISSCVGCHREAKPDSLFGIGHFGQKPEK